MPSASLAELRARIAAIEGTGPRRGAGVLTLGVAAIDAALPWGGLPLGCLHEVAPTVEDGPALGYAAVWLGRLAALRSQPVLWVAANDDLYVPGLAALGLAAERLVMVRPRAKDQMLWAVEEGLHCPGLAGLLGEVWGLDATVARRLHLAARASGVTALLLNRGAAGGTAFTRWRVAPAASEAPPDQGVGPWRWRVELSRCRGRTAAGEGEGLAGGTSWLVEWNDEARCLRLAAASGDRPAQPARRRQAG